MVNAISVACMHTNMHIAPEMIRNDSLITANEMVSCQD